MKIKKIKNLLTFLLAVLLLVPSVFSCSKKEDDKTENDVTDEQQDEHQDEQWLSDDIPSDLKFDGETFNIYLAYPLEAYYVEEETGDIVEDTAFRRNMAVEARFGINLVYTDKGFGLAGTGSDQNIACQQISTLIQAGDTSYDVYVHVQHSSMPGFIAAKMFRDWSEYPYFNFDKEYWYRKCIDDINYNGKIYAMTGAYNLPTLTYANCLLFNKRILSSLSLDAPYEKVKQNAWVMDEWKNYLKVGTADLNGDSVIDPAMDQTSYWGWGWEQMPSLYMACGGDTVVKQSDGSPLLNLNNERTFAIYDKIQEIFGIEGCNYEYVTYGPFNEAFAAGNLMFLHSSIANMFRDMKDDYGYVPYPMLDEQQDDYRVRVQNTSCLTYIPQTNTRDEITSAVLEYMAMYSFNTVVPAFFEKSLSEKGIRDNGSLEMVPIIRNACSFNDEAVGFNIHECIQNKESFAVYWAKNEQRMNEELKTCIVEAYSDNN